MGPKAHKFHCQMGPTFLGIHLPKNNGQMPLFIQQITINLLSQINYLNQIGKSKTCDIMQKS